MEALDTLKQSLTDLTAENSSLIAKVELGNTKQDLLIAAVGQVLARLKELQDASNQGGNVTAADLQPLIEQANAVIAASKAEEVKLDAQALETDAGTAAATSAVGEETPPAPAPEPAPAPPADDAFVAVGSTRFSDGQVQTDESLAAAIAAWNTLHPESPITP